MIRLLSCLAVASANLPAGMNQFCDTPDSGIRCNSDCEQVLVACLGACDGADVTCQQECNRNHAFCVTDCPCFENCFDGCPCTNSTTQDPYYCGPEVDMAMMVPFVTYRPGAGQPIQSIPGPTLLVHWDEMPELNSVNELAPEPDFSGLNDGMCSFTMRGEHYVFGGQQHSRSAWKMTPCGFQSIANLPWSFSGGRCTAVDWGYNGFLCYGTGHGQECKKFDGTSYTTLAYSKYSHQGGGIQEGNGRIIAMAGLNNIEFEEYDQETGIWEHRGDMSTAFPGNAAAYKEFATGAMANHIWAFGGIEQFFAPVTHVFKLNLDTMIWSMHNQELMMARSWFMATTGNAHIIMVERGDDQNTRVPTDSIRPMEKWTWNGVDFDIDTYLPQPKIWRGNNGFHETFIVRGDDFKDCVVSTPEYP